MKTFWTTLIGMLIVLFALVYQRHNTPNHIKDLEKLKESYIPFGCTYSYELFCATPLIREVGKKYPDKIGYCDFRFSCRQWIRLLKVNKNGSAVWGEQLNSTQSDEDILFKTDTSESTKDFANYVYQHYREMKDSNDEITRVKKNLGMIK